MLRVARFFDWRMIQSDWRAGWLVRPALVILVAFLLVAHGCHGPDEDHEPAVVPVGSERE
jgi:hypothetical protein